MSKLGMTKLNKENPESKKVMLLGIGETGLEVTRIIDRDEVKGIATCAIENESELEQLTGNVIEEAELIILVADLGYKKENSLALQVAELAKTHGKIVVSFLTTPRLFEGERVIMHALETALTIGRKVDGSLVLNKETFNAVPENGCSFAELINSLVSVEETIADSIQKMMNLVSESGGINIDLDDLETTLRESGTFIIESGVGVGENRVSDALEAALSSPVMSKCDIYTSRRILIKLVTSSQTELRTDEISALSKFLEKLPSNVDVKWGLGKSDNLQGEVEVILLASGFDVKI